MSREPLALTQVLAHSSSWGQILVCEVLGCRIPFSIICGYRNPSPTVEEASTALAETFTKVQHKHSITCLDWNMPQGSNALTDIMNLVGGRYLGGSGHQSSTQDIDTVWVSESLVAEKIRHMPQISDHDGSLIHVDKVDLLPSPPNWMFRPHAPISCPGAEDTQVQSDVPANWERCACHTEVWQELCQHASIDNLWAQWSADTEKFLQLSGILAKGTHYQHRGSQPKLWSAPSNLGSGQSIRERQLRRHLRRIHEILAQLQHGKRPDVRLVRKVKHMCRCLGQVEPIGLMDWGRLRTHTKDLLDIHLNQAQKDALASWRQRVSTMSGACKWVKKHSPPAWTLEHEGRVSTGRSGGAALLHQAWKPVFNGDCDYVPQVAQFLETYGPWLPTFEPVTVPDLNSDNLIKVLKTMKHKAAGTDGWSVELLLEMPTLCLERLIQVLNRIEAQGQWPSQLYHWRISFY